MKLLFLLLFLAKMSMGVPQKVEIDSSLYFEGTKVGSPRIITKRGLSAKIVMNDQIKDQEYNFEVLPIKNGNDPMVLKYTLAIRNSQGETLSRGRISLEDGQPGEILLDRGRIKILIKYKES